MEKISFIFKFETRIKFVFAGSELEDLKGIVAADIKTVL